MEVIGALHESLVFSRRVRVLGEALAEVLPSSASVLDVGAGDGTIAHLVQGMRPDIRCEGIDVLVRPVTRIPVSQFDGSTIPFESGSFDVVMFVDVLHHTTNQVDLLKEALRVSRRGIVIKDHCRDGLLASETLRIMDWVGNARHGVALPYNYWKRKEWLETFKRLGVTPQIWLDDLALYPFPFSLAFDRKLHFLAFLT